jgi:hypothetical protein
MVLGVWGCAICPGSAKPPDLPAKQTVTCQPPVTQTVGDDGLIRTGIDFSNLPKDLVVTEEEQESLQPLDLVCPCFWEILRSYWQSWSLSLMEIGSGNPEAGRTTPSSPSSKGQPTCPYLRENSIRKERAEPSAAPSSVLENLEKLEQAQTLWRQAEDSRRKGDWDAASAGYVRIQKMCPGSSFGRMAAEQLHDLQARGIVRASVAGAAEEQEPHSQPEKPRQ